jgi:hypothetical protein
MKSLPSALELVDSRVVGERALARAPRLDDASPAYARDPCFAASLVRIAIAGHGHGNLAQDQAADIEQLLDDPLRGRQSVVPLGEQLEQRRRVAMSRAVVIDELHAEIRAGAFERVAARRCLDIAEDGGEGALAFQRRVVRRRLRMGGAPRGCRHQVHREDEE